MLILIYNNINFTEDETEAERDSVSYIVRGAMEADSNPGIALKSLF